MRDVITTILLTAVLLVLTAPSASASWLIYHKPEFRGRMIDAETKQPIEGVVVVALYRSHPIISGPGGGSSSIIHVREALTDSNGEFIIPAYTTVIQPNSYEDRTDFIIYKPGYGSYPHRSQQNRIYPFDYCGPEILFSKEIGTREEIQHKSQLISITYGVAELPRLHTKEERLRATPPRPFEFIKDTPLLHKAINDERKGFGLGPVGGGREPNIAVPKKVPETPFSQSPPLGKSLDPKTIPRGPSGSGGAINQPSKAPP
jgi:hypothetical protein